MNWLTHNLLLSMGALAIVLVGVGVIVARVSKDKVNNKPNVYNADEDLDLVDDSTLLSVRNDFPPAARKLWEELIEDVRKETGGVVRQAHMYWMIDVIVRGVPRHPVYKCDPPADWNEKHLGANTQGS